MMLIYREVEIGPESQVVSYEFYIRVIIQLVIKLCVVMNGIK